MRTHTQTFKDEIKEFGREFNDEMYIYDVSSNLYSSYGQDYINKFEYYVNGSLLKSIMQEIRIDTSLKQLEIDDELSYYDLKLSNNEYVRFNHFIIKKKEEQKDTNSCLYTCYDNMINAMKDYETPKISGVAITYPITVRNYLSAICETIGVTFGSSSDNFTNYNQNITSEHYLDSDGNSIGYTFRDVLDDLAEATGSFICIDNNGNLIVKGITTTSDTIDEEYFQDTNVNIGKHYGPINVVTLSRNGVDNLVRPTTLPQTITEIKIENNPILDQTNREDFINGIYNNLNGLEFYLNDFQLTGVCYYEVGDIFNVSIGGVTYPCILLGDTIKRDEGLTENIFTEEPTTSVGDYKYASDTDKLDKTARNAYFLADKANGTAEMIVQGIGDNGQVTGASVIASINDDSSNLTLNADKINLNGAVTANNNFKIKNDGSVEINNGNILLYDDGTDTIDAVISVYEEGQGTNIKDTEIYSYGVRVYRNEGGYTNYFTDLSYNGLNHEISSFDTSQPQYQFSLTTDELLLLKRAGTTGHPTLDYAIYGNTENCIEIGYSNNAYFRVKRTNNGCDMYINRNATIGENLKVGNIKSKNLFNYNDVTGGWLKYDDTFYNQYTTTYCVSNYIEVEPSTTYTLDLIDATGLSSAGINEYNSSKTFTSSQQETNQIITFTTSSTTKYIRFTCRQDSKNYVQLEEGSLSTTFTEYKGIGYVSGKNENGNYIKYDDGILMCWGTIDKTKFLQTTSTYTTVQTIKWYRSALANQTLPVSYANNDYRANITLTTGLNGARMMIPRISSKSTGIMEVQIIGIEDFLQNANGYKDIVDVNWVTIGRWR